MKQPSKIALRFLRWFCREDRIDEVEGDILELYFLRLQKNDKMVSHRLAWDVIRAFRWTNLKRFVLLTDESILLRSYFKTAFRQLKDDLSYSLMNVFGLSLGIAAFLLMLLMVYHEYSFDHFHQKSQRIFQVVQEFKTPDGIKPEIFTSLNLSKALRQDMSGIETAVSVHSASDTWFTYKGDRYFEENGIVAGAQFFEIFDFELIHGDESKLLTNQNSIVIARSLAMKIFGRTHVIGEVIEVERYGYFTITGVLENVPSNSFIQFDYILTQDYDVFFTHVAPWFPKYFESWQGDPAATFVLMEKAADINHFQENIKPLLKKYMGDVGPINDFYLVNLLDIHLNTNHIDGEINRYVKGDQLQIELFGVVSILILLMACFNYINTATARSINRIKEIGIRKTFGAHRKQLQLQFMTESFVTTFLAFALGLFIVYLALPYFNKITGIGVALTLDLLGKFSPYLLATIILITVLAGFYPSIYISRFSVLNLFKSGTGLVKKNQLRNGLVTLQFGIVLVLLSCLWIIEKQYDFVQRKDLGFETEQLVIVEVNGGGVRSNYTSLKLELLANPKIQEVTVLTRMIGGYRESVRVLANKPNEPMKDLVMQFYGMDEDGISALGLDLLQGSEFTGDRSLDSTTVFLNEKAAASLGDELIGNRILLTDEEGEQNFSATVAGIIKDFHYGSLHDPIGPVVLGYYLNPFEGLDDIVIRIAGDDIINTIDYIEQAHNKFDENDVMTWEFMDDMLQRAYEKEATYRQVFVGATVIAVLIAVLGLVGLVSYQLKARVKEIGIRKVLGASYLELLTLQSQDFAKLLILSFLIAAPIFWYFGKNWLENFAYRVVLTPIPIILSLLLVSILTVITIWIINHKVVNKNPVEALRYE